MKLSNRQLLNSVTPLNKLNEFKLPVKTSFKLAKLARIIDGALEDYQKTLTGIQDKHAKKNGKGEKQIVDDTIQFKNRKAFDKAFEELLDCEIDVKLDAITVDDLSDVQVEPSTLYHLDWLIDE